MLEDAREDSKETDAEYMKPSCMSGVNGEHEIRICTDDEQDTIECSMFITS